MKSNGYGIAIAILMVISGFMGWCFISLVLWLLSFVHISFGG
ncbi:MAG: hypothetical protein [Bacteriophage sp.]|nr:MAG: hypothetical protein [Bacteriophage sp.]